MVSITSARIRTEINRQNALSQAIARAQTDVSTQTRLQVASDDPVASARVAVIRRAEANQTGWTANIATAAATADRADTVMAGVQTSLDQVKELMLRAGNGTTTAADRTAISAQLAGIREDVASQIGTKDTDGNAIFPEGEPLAYPVGAGETLKASASRADAFGDLYTMLGQAIDALAVTDDTARSTAITDSLAAVDGAAGKLADSRAAQGVRMQRLDTLKERYADSAVTLGDEKSALAGTDMAGTLAFIQQSLTGLNAAQTAFARVNAKTLFDLLG